MGATDVTGPLDAQSYWDVLDAPGGSWESRTELSLRCAGGLQATGVVFRPGDRTDLSTWAADAPGGRTPVAGGELRIIPGAPVGRVAGIVTLRLEDGSEVKIQFDVEDEQRCHTMEPPPPQGPDPGAAGSCCLSGTSCGLEILSCLSGCGGCIPSFHGTGGSHSGGSTGGHSSGGGGHGHVGGHGHHH